MKSWWSYLDLICEYRLLVHEMHIIFRTRISWDDHQSHQTHHPVGWLDIAQFDIEKLNCCGCYQAIFRSRGFLECCCTNLYLASTDGASSNIAGDSHMRSAILVLAPAARRSATILSLFIIKASSSGVRPLSRAMRSGFVRRSLSNSSTMSSRLFCAYSSRQLAERPGMSWAHKHVTVKAINNQERLAWPWKTEIIPLKFNEISLFFIT